MTSADGLIRSYRAAFLSYLPRRDEAALHRGYELGRAAVVERRSLLELVHVHHQVLAEVLQETPADEVASVATAASEFLLEVLATFDMTQRQLRATSPSGEA